MTTFAGEFFRTYWMYAEELWLTLAVGFLISGIVSQFISTDMVERHFGQRGVQPILMSSLIGTLLPVCCIGSLPIAVTLRRKGATLGAVLAFMVATPATSISALIVCWKLLGVMFTVVIFFCVILMAMVMGIVIDRLKWSAHDTASDTEQGACCKTESTGPGRPAVTVGAKIKNALGYAFVTLPKEIGMEILIGIAVASLIAVSEPIQHVIRGYLTGATGYLFVLVTGVLTYVCSTASVPMADALLTSGLSYGQALCYLLVGPITSYGTILVIKKDFGARVLVIYLGIICALSLAYGLIYDMFMG